MSATTKNTAAKQLSQYLNDHLAGETLDIEAVKHASVETKGTRLSTFLELLSWALEEDMESLVHLMGELGVRRRHAGMIVTRIAEKAGRLKFPHSSPVSTMTELESAQVGIGAKINLWNTLRSTVGDRVTDTDFDELVHRAEGQAEALEQRRLELAAGVLRHRDGSPAGIRPTT